MRNITVKRRKKFVACLCTLKVYIEDSASSELEIGGVPCRMLGTLKNGEEKTFEVDGEARKLYVIADRVSKIFCNDFYQLPESDEDICLVGENRYNPATGNAFRFDGQEGEEAKSNRRRGIVRGLIFLAVAIAVGFGIGTLISELPSMFSSPKTFEADGVRITLTDDMKPVEMKGFDFCYSSEDVVVFALKERFDIMDGFEDYTLEEYGELVLNTNEQKVEKGLQTKNGLTYFEYEAASDGENFAYTVFLYKSSDSFWMVQIATSVSNADKIADDRFEWASSVEFIGN